MSRIVYSATEVTVGDVVAYPARFSARSRARARGRTARDWLTVTRVEGRWVYGTRVHPEEWERDIEFTVYPLQIEENGLELACR